MGYNIVNEIGITQKMKPIKQHNPDKIIKNKQRTGYYGSQKFSS